LTDAPIGVFDSGVGGLTVLRALIGELPAERFVYLGDTARLPYGTKSTETVAHYAVQAAEALSEYDIKHLVVACNTASAVGLPCVAERFEGMQVSGVIEPGAEAACAASRSGRIAVIGTEGTIRGGAYQEAVHRRRADARLTGIATQLFVALAEEGVTEGPIAEAAARFYLEDLFGGTTDENKPDTLVLGCTHFPMLANAIRAVVGPQVTLVDSAATTAQQVRRLLASCGALRGGGAGSVRFLATDSVERFARVGSRFLGRPVTEDEVELINL
jgi:glutamate racemase